MLYLPYVVLLYTYFLAVKVNGSAFLCFFRTLSLMHTLVGSSLKLFACLNVNHYSAYLLNITYSHVWSKYRVTNVSLYIDTIAKIMSTVTLLHFIVVIMIISLC